MSEQKLGLFNGEDMPDVLTAWDCYEKGLEFNNSINLEDTVRVNENFFTGKQWEGVQANGLPTPVFNILKRVVGFIIATITTDNLKVNVTALANSVGTDSYRECVRIVGEECDALMVHNNVPALVREFARNAAVDGDGCIYTYWDPTVNVGGGVMGAIRSKILENTRVFFGNPNDRRVQTQPYIQLITRELVRNVKIRAKASGSQDWEQILPDDEETTRQEDVFHTDDKVTVVLTLWRNSEDGTIWAYESTQNCEIREPWSLGLRKYPITWFNWDYIQDCYHGQAMITGLIPNQIFINKAFAMSMLSIMRTAWPKVVYDRTRVKKWDNRVGGAIGVDGNVTGVADIIDPAAIQPQIAQYIQMAIEQTQESLGATESALGGGKAYNTSAILSLQKAASTPTEMAKQNLYKAVEDMFEIYVDFIGEYYGTRKVDMPTPPELQQVFQFIGQPTPEEIPMDFDFTVLKEYPMLLKVEVGASSYYSEIAAMQTLDQLLQGGFIDIVDYLERVPDSYVPGRRKLIAKKQQQIEQQQMMQQMMAMGMPPGMMSPPSGEADVPQAGVQNPMQGMGMGMPMMGGPPSPTPPTPTPNPQPSGGDEGKPISAYLNKDPEITGGRGYRAAARAVNGQA